MRKKVVGIAVGVVLAGVVAVSMGAAAVKGPELESSRVDRVAMLVREEASQFAARSDEAKVVTALFDYHSHAASRQSAEALFDYHVASEAPLSADHSTVA